MTAVKYTMSPDEVERWSANVASFINAKASNLRVKEARQPTPGAGYSAVVVNIGACGHPTNRGAIVCRSCWKAQRAAQKQERQATFVAACGHLATQPGVKRCGVCRKVAGDARRAITKPILERTPDRTLSPSGHKSRLLRAGRTIIAIEEFLPLICNLDGCSEPATKTGRCERHEAIWVRLHA